jgi:hypothetical protein
MTDPSDDPNYWLERAKETRDTAKQISDQKMRNILEKIAKGYEHVAELITSESSNGGQSKP